MKKLRFGKWIITVLVMVCFCSTVKASWNNTGAWQGSSSSSGTVDGSGTLNEITYWVDSDTLGTLAVATYPSLTELAYLKGVTSAIQTQFGLKAPLASPTFTGTVTIPTPFTIGAVSMTATGTELNYVAGVTSSLQTQLGLKAPLASPTFTGTFTLPVGLTGLIRADTGVASVDTDVTDLVTAASLTVAGKVEGATTAEINTGTDSTRFMPIDQYVASNRNVRYPSFRIVEATTNVAVATTKGGDWEVPYDCTITGVGAYTDTAGVTGTMTIDVNKNGTTIMTTNKVTIDTAEKSSRTAVTAPVLTTTTLLVGDIITIDNDVIHTTPAKGEVVWLSIRMN